MRFFLVSFFLVGCGRPAVQLTAGQLWRCGPAYDRALGQEMTEEWEIGAGLMTVRRPPFPDVQAPWAVDGERLVLGGSTLVTRPSSAVLFFVDEYPGRDYATRLECRQI